MAWMCCTFAGRPEGTAELRQGTAFVLGGGRNGKTGGDGIGRSRLSEGKRHGTSLLAGYCDGVQCLKTETGRWNEKKRFVCRAYCRPNGSSGSRKWSSTVLFTFPSIHLPAGNGETGRRILPLRAKESGLPAVGQSDGGRRDERDHSDLQAPRRLLPLAYPNHKTFCGHPPFSDGKGDVVREMAQACRGEGLAFALIFPPGIGTRPAMGRGRPMTIFHRPADRTAHRIWGDFLRLAGRRLRRGKKRQETEL